PAEKRLILEEWSQGEREATTAESVHDLISARAALSPDAVAVSCAGQQLSYAELEHWAKRLARRLMAAGAGRGRVVAVCMERRVELIWSLLGVLKAGAAFLPMDPQQPAARLRYMVEDAGAAAVVTEAAVAARVEFGGRRVIGVEEALAEMSEQWEG